MKLYITEKGSQVKNLKAALIAEGVQEFDIAALSGHITETLSPSDYKEVKMGYNIDIGDYNTRLKRAKEFLSKGCL